SRWRLGVEPRRCRLGRRIRERWNIDTRVEVEEPAAVRVPSTGDFQPPRLQPSGAGPAGQLVPAQRELLTEVGCIGDLQPLHINRRQTEPYHWRPRAVLA